MCESNLYLECLSLFNLHGYLQARELICKRFHLLDVIQQVVASFHLARKERATHKMDVGQWTQYHWFVSWKGKNALEFKYLIFLEGGNIFFQLSWLASDFSSSVFMLFYGLWRYKFVGTRRKTCKAACI